MRVIYLHGFASSATSSKATFFKAKLTARGTPVAIPDLNEPDFGTLTVTRMLREVTGAIDGGSGPVALMGASLGAFVAVQAALARPALVDRLVLLAPALDADRLRDLAPGGLDAWKATNALNVVHYGYGRTIPVHYELYADARLYDCVAADLAMPVQVFQGRRDRAVDPEFVEGWSRTRPNVELHMLDDDHQLLGSLEHIWREVESFLFRPAYQQIP